MARESTLVTACDPFRPARAHAFYNLAFGQVLADARGCQTWDGPRGASADAHAADRFRLIGPVAPGPLTFDVALHIDGGVGGEGTSSAALWDEDGHSAYDCVPGSGGLQRTLTITVSHVVGEEFVVHYSAAASAGGTASVGFMEGYLSFVGLPPYYGVASCQGFSGEGAVPTRHETWGTLKIRYR